MKKQFILGVLIIAFIAVAVLISQGFIDLGDDSTLSDAGVEITELSTHLQGQLVAVNPAYNEAFDAFAPEAVHGNPAARRGLRLCRQCRNAAVRHGGRSDAHRPTDQVRQGTARAGHRHYLHQSPTR